MDIENKDERSNEKEVAAADPKESLFSLNVCKSQTPNAAKKGRQQQNM